MHLYYTYIFFNKYTYIYLFIYIYTHLHLNIYAYMHMHMHIYSIYYIQYIQYIYIIIQLYIYINLHMDIGLLDLQLSPPSKTYMCTGQHAQTFPQKIPSEKASIRHHVQGQIFQVVVQFLFDQLFLAKSIRNIYDTIDIPPGSLKIYIHC